MFALVAACGLFAKPPVGTLTLLQHGSTSWSKADRIEGWGDPDLSEEGVEQAGEAAQALLKSGYSFDLAYTSMLKRSVRTCWVVLQELDLSYVQNQRLWRLNSAGDE